MKHLLLVLVLVAVTTTAEGQNCRADLDDNRVVNFGDFMLFVNQFNLTPSTGCTPMPNQIDDLRRCNEALRDSSRVIARKDSLLYVLQVRNDSLFHIGKGYRDGALWLQEENSRLERERETYAHEAQMWGSVGFLYPLDREEFPGHSERLREDLCRSIWWRPWPATREVLYFLQFMGVISGEESSRIQGISRYSLPSGDKPIYQDSNWDSRVNDERTREAKKAAGCSDWPRN